MNHRGNIKVVDDLTVNGTNVYYSKSFEIGFAAHFGLWSQVTSVLGTPNLKIELEHSYVKPTTEGSSDSNYVVPEGYGDIYSSLTSELVKVKSFSPVPMKYARFKITGNSGNQTDSILNLVVFIVER